MKNNSKRILMLLENCPYPQDTRVRQEANTLVEAGHKVTVISPKRKGQKSVEDMEGVLVYRFPNALDANGFMGYILEYGNALIMSFFFSMKVFFKRGFDVIHAHNPPDIFVLLALFYKLFGKKFIFDHHDLSPDMYFARFPGKDNQFIFKTLLFFEKLSCRIADHVIVTNESYKKIDSTRAGKDVSDITVVRNGPILENLSFRKNGYIDSKTSTVKLCYVGDMGYHDGLDYLIRSLHLLVNTYRTINFHCTLVGGGDAFESVKKLATDLKLSEQVTFVGRVAPEEVADFILDADICLAPEPSNSYNDRSTVIKILEYMAFAKPIVAFKLPEHSFSAGDAALYATPSEEADFAKQILNLINNPEQRKKLGQTGRKRMQEKLSWEHQKIALLKVYQNI